MAYTQEAKPLVSVIMPSYNAEKYIKEAIESVIAQTYTNWELFVIDDGSTDGSGTILDGYARSDDRIHVFHQENSGQFFAREKGFSPHNSCDCFRFFLYCGLLSASKSFIIITACLFFVWIPTLLKKQNRGSTADKVFIGLLCAGIIVLSSTAFQELFKIIDTRFSYASSVSELTTGRTDLWQTYINEFIHNPVLVLLGEGFSSVIIGKRASHNTIIQGVFQFGIIGFPFLIAWFVITIKNLISNISDKKPHFLYILLMGVGIVLPWMALDIIFFDELFLLPVYGALAVAYSSLELENSK